MGVFLVCAQQLLNVPSICNGDIQNGQPPLVFGAISLILAETCINTRKIFDQFN